MIPRRTAAGVNRLKPVTPCTCASPGAARPVSDHAAARDVGFRCVWIDRDTGRKLLPDYTPDAILPTLDRVPQLFDELGWL